MEKAIQSTERERPDSNKGIRKSRQECLLEFLPRTRVGVAGSWIKEVILRELPESLRQNWGAGRAHFIHPVFVAQLRKSGVRQRINLGRALSLVVL